MLAGLAVAVARLFFLQRALTDAAKHIGLLARSASAKNRGVLVVFLGICDFFFLWEFFYPLYNSQHVCARRVLVAGPTKPH